MKKIVLIVAMAVMSLSAVAQENNASSKPQSGAFGYVNFEELFMLMPEMDEVRATLEENQKEHEELLMSMYQEYQNKMAAYEQKQAEWTPAIRESKQKELQSIGERFEQTRQSLNQELQQLQNQLQAPIYEKLQAAVTELAKSKGLAFVLDQQSFVYFDAAQLVDLNQELKATLNITRTIDDLRAEIQAKAQATQAAQAQ